MNITINAPIESNRNGFEDATVRRVSRALARFSHRISRVDVTLLDENGPRGGVDKSAKSGLSCLALENSRRPPSMKASGRQSHRRRTKLGEWCWQG